MNLQAEEQKVTELNQVRSDAKAELSKLKEKLLVVGDPLGKHQHISIISYLSYHIPYHTIPYHTPYHTISYHTTSYNTILYFTTYHSAYHIIISYMIGSDILCYISQHVKLYHTVYHILSYLLITYLVLFQR